MLSVRMAYLLWLPSLFGVCGLHRFYLGKFGTGLLYFMTGGLFGLGTLYDAFTLPDQVRETRLKYRYQAALDAEDQAFFRRIGLDIGGGSDRQGENGERRKESVEHVVLRLAKKNRGIATPAEVALEGGVSADEAKELLEQLVNKGFAEVRVRKTGTLVYVFTDFLDEETSAQLETM